MQRTFKYQGICRPLSELVKFSSSCRKTDVVMSFAEDLRRIKGQNKVNGFVLNCLPRYLNPIKPGAAESNHSHVSPSAVLKL